MGHEIFVQSKQTSSYTGDPKYYDNSFNNELLLCVSTKESLLDRA